MLRNGFSNPFTRRRGATAVFVVIMLPVIAGFAALTVDVGMLYSTRADLQNSADAAAMAGARALTTDDMMRLRMNAADTYAMSVVRLMVERSIAQVSRHNHSFGASQTSISPGDVGIGWLDLTSATEPLNTGASPSSYNAVQVVVRRSTESRNGPVNLLFAWIFGKRISDVTASAAAAFDDRFSRYSPDGNGPALLPISVNIALFDSAMSTGGDAYALDPMNGTISSGSDGLRELIAYPGEQAPGNYGLLNIGVDNQGLTVLAEQVENGVTPAELEMETGSSELTFVDENGDPATYTITGNPGYKANLEESFDDHVGELIGFFVHDVVYNSGSNAEYEIVGIRWAHVMDVKLKTSYVTRGLWLQPVAYTGPDISTNPLAPSSGGAVGRFVLAR